MSEDKEVSRRKFLKLCGLTSAAAAIGIASSTSKVSAASSDQVPGAAQYSFLFDSSKCVNCRACVIACKRWNNLNGDVSQTEPADLASNTWNVVNTTKSSAGATIYVKEQCLHCLEPACVFGCPTGALKKYDQGQVVIDPERCIGCRNCLMVCPFQIPKFDDVVGVSRKCWMCYNRSNIGLPTACVESCPHDALDYGTRAEMVSEAEARATAINGYVFGETEAGGTNVLYVSQAPLGELTWQSPAQNVNRFANVSNSSYPTLVVNMVKSVLEVGVVVAAVAAAALLFISRRKTSKAQET